MDILLCPALLIGFVISLVEFAFVHGDEPGGIGIQHAVGTFLPTMLMTFVCMNAGLALDLMNMSESLTTDLLVRGGVAVISIIWINAKASIGRGVGEKLPHSFVIAALVFASYYIWTYVLDSMIGGMLPC